MRQGFTPYWGYEVEYRLGLAVLPLLLALMLMRRAGRAPPGPQRRHVA
jgi:hypothetical protein